MSSYGGYASSRRFLAAVGIACVLMVGCTGQGTDQAPTLAEPLTPTPTVSGRVGSLAYGVDGDIYVADWDGSNPFRIVDGRPQSDCRGIGEYWGEGSFWSPDGRYLAYRHTDCEHPRARDHDVVISDPEGNVVASFPSEGWSIPWSPDSTRVAVWVHFLETIGVYGLDGKRQALLTVPPGIMAGGDFDPEWSPDGTSLLMPGGVEVPLDGGTPRQLPSSDPRSYPHAYSPDGSRVAYATGHSLVLAAADGSNAREVFGDWTSWTPVWSPTGDRIAFTSNHFHQLRVLDVVIGTVTLVAEMDGSERLWNIDFSGDRILFAKWDEEERVSSLWTIYADGSDPHRLVTGTLSGDWRSLSQTR